VPTELFDFIDTEKRRTSDGGKAEQGSAKQPAQQQLRNRKLRFGGSTGKKRLRNL
jgi:hypothetical protein